MTEFVPASAKDISASWLKDALKLAKEPEALEHNQIGKDYGFASHIFRFGWQENLQAKSVVIKFWPIKSEKDITEIKFYKTFQPLGIRTPDYLYGAHSSEHAVLILEDINEAEQGDVLKPLDLLRAKKVARNLAVLHSKWLQHPLLEQNWLTRHLTWRSSANWIQERRKQFLERFPDHLSNQAHLVLEKLERVIPVVDERLRDAPATLVHGDFHLDNLLFKKQDPIFLDWSKPMQGAASFNLAQLLLLMTNTNYFDDVYNAYTNAYQKQADLNPAQFNMQLGASILQLFSYLTCGISRWQPDLARARQMIRDGIARADQMIQFWQKRDPALFSFLN